MIKHVDIELLHPDTHKVLRHWRIHPPRSKDGKRQAFTPEGVDSALENIIALIDKAGPGHKYHLVPVGKGKFRFVWREKAGDDKSGD